VAAVRAALTPDERHRLLHTSHAGGRHPVG
jgi:hypothetical protein